MERMDPWVWVLVLIFFVLYVVSIVWAYRDAKHRGKPGWAVALLIALLSWPVSLLLWIVFRPETRYSS